MIYLRAGGIKLAGELGNGNSSEERAHPMGEFGTGQGGLAGEKIIASKIGL